MFDIYKICFGNNGNVELSVKLHLCIYMGVQVSNELKDLVIPPGHNAVKNVLTLEMLVTQKMPSSGHSRDVSFCWIHKGT